jgi:serine/threonine protein kinase
MPEIAGYQLGRILGAGSFGETYEAERGAERVALKVIKADAMLRGFDPKRFRREVQGLQKIVGPRIVGLLDWGVAPLGNDDRYYIALELLEGQDLARAFLAAGRVFAEPDLRRILRQVTRVYSNQPTRTGSDTLIRDGRDDPSHPTR